MSVEIVGIAILGVILILCFFRYCLVGQDYNCVMMLYSGCIATCIFQTVVSVLVIMARVFLYLLSVIGVCDGKWLSWLNNDVSPLIEKFVFCLLCEVTVMAILKGLFPLIELRDIVRFSCNCVLLILVIHIYVVLVHPTLSPSLEISSLKIFVEN